MILGIDAGNIRNSGGLTHLNEFLKNFKPNLYFEKVVIWSNIETLETIPNYDWLVKKTHKFLNLNFFYTFLFQIIY